VAEKQADHDLPAFLVYKEGSLAALRPAFGGGPPGRQDGAIGKDLHFLRLQCYTAPCTDEEEQICHVPAPATGKYTLRKELYWTLKREALAVFRSPARGTATHEERGSSQSAQADGCPPQTVL